MVASMNLVAAPCKAFGRFKQVFSMVFVVAFALITSAAFAQQGGGSAPSLITPRNQNSESTTLELPVAPRQQTEQRQEFKPLVPQQQELEIAPRQLKAQSGYAQVTVTVTDPAGGYVSGLKKDDFQVYENGQQRPIEFFRRDLNAPVSVGILVDT